MMNESVEALFHEVDANSVYRPKMESNSIEANEVLPKTREIKKYETKHNREKKRQADYTILWLKQHYCPCPEVCLPREIIFDHYLEFCRNQKLVPTCKATFGKIIRNTFPGVTSKRLGARGQSKYHYNGIGIKQNANDFRNTHFSKNAITRFSTRVTNNSEEASPKKFSLNAKVGTLLPRFPDIKDLFIPDAATKEKIGIFLTMYRMHCQCIVDVTISGNFDEIQFFLLHFWQGCPDHLVSIFDENVTLDLISACDSILYKTLIDVLIPMEVMDISERLLLGIQNLASHWEKWLECSIENMPLQMREFKMIQGKRFSNVLKRNIAFLHIAQVSRPVFTEFTMHSLKKELVELETQGLMTDGISNLLILLQHLIEKESFIEALIAWLDEMVYRIIRDNADITEKARHYILHWVYTLKEVSFYLTEDKTNNFIPFHLLSCLFQEYLMLAFETERDKRQEQIVHAKLKLHLNPSAAFATDYFKSPSSCFLVAHRKPLNDHRNIAKRKHNLKEHRTSIQKYSDSVDLIQLHPTEQSNHWTIRHSIPLVEHTKSKAFIQSNCCHQFTGVNVPDSSTSQCSKKVLQMNEYSIAINPFTPEVPLSFAMNEQNYFNPQQKNVCPLSIQSNIQYENFKSDFIAGYIDACNPTLSSSLSTTELSFNHQAYTDFTTCDFKTNSFAT